MRSLWIARAKTNELALIIRAIFNVITERLLGKQCVNQNAKCKQIGRLNINLWEYYLVGSDGVGGEGGEIGIWLMICTEEYIF